ncbi:ParA family protein [Bacillus sp. JJ634]
MTKNINDKKAKVYGVIQNKGGVLKSTICTNMASELSLQGKKVLIIDVDNQSNVLYSFGLNPDAYENTMYDVLSKQIDIEEVVVEVSPNLHVALSNDDMSYFEMDVLTNPEDYPNFAYLLKGAIDKVRDKYDVIFVDTPPSFGLNLMNVLHAIDEAIVPFHPEIFSVRSMIKTIQAIDNFKEKNPNLKICGVVPTKVQKSTTLHKETLRECRKYCKEHGVTVTKTVIPKTIAFSDSLYKNKKPWVLTEASRPRAIFQNIMKELNI